MFIYIITIMFLVAMGMVIFIAFRLSNEALYPQMFDFDETYEIEVEKGNIDHDAYEKLTKEQIEISTLWGYKLNGIYVPFLMEDGSESDKTVILAHGITYTLNGSIKYMNVFRENGYNIMMYDHRAHGKSGGKTVTLGHHESSDLSSVISLIKERGNNRIIGLHGESMGAVVALKCAAEDPRVDFVIEDCGFSSLNEILNVRLLKEKGRWVLPFIPLASLITWFREGFLFGMISPVNDVTNMEDVPVLFIHGLEDRYVPTYMCIKLYAAKSGPKDLLLVEGARHSGSIGTDPRSYHEAIGKFITKVEEDK